VPGTAAAVSEQHQPAGVFRQDEVAVKVYPAAGIRAAVVRMVIAISFLVGANASNASRGSAGVRQTAHAAIDPVAVRPVPFHSDEREPLSPINRQLITARHA
jgi:hypothetical protein